MAKSDEKLLRVHIQLYERDWEKLEAYFGGRVKRSGAVRDIVRGWLRHVEAKAECSSSHHGRAPTT